MMRALLLLLVGGGVALDQNHPNLEEVGHLSSERSDQVQERSRRQLDFDGGGGGVNDYVNGELDFVSGDFEADQGTGDGDGADEQDFWRTAMYEDLEGLEPQPEIKYDPRKPAGKKFSKDRETVPKKRNAIFRKRPKKESAEDLHYIHYTPNDEPVDKAQRRALHLPDLGKALKEGLRIGSESLKTRLRQFRGIDEPARDIRVVQSRSRPPKPPKPPKRSKQIEEARRERTNLDELDRLNAPLRPGPPYDDQVLIQNFVKNELEPELVPEVKAVVGGQFELEKEPPIPNLINHQNRANHQKKQKTISPDKFDPIEATTGSHSDGDLDRARNGGITFGEEEIVLTSTELQNKSPKGREDKSPLGGIPDFFSSLMKNGGGIGNPGEGILLNSVIRIPGKEDLVYEYPGEDPEIIKLQQLQRKDLTNFKPPKSLSGQFVRSKVSKNQFVPNKNHAEVLTNQINTDTFQDKVSPPKMFDNVKGGIAQMLKEKEMSGGGSYLDNNNNGGNVKNEKKKSNFEKGYYDPFEVNSGDDLERGWGGVGGGGGGGGGGEEEEIEKVNNQRPFQNPLSNPFTSFTTSHSDNVNNVNSANKNHEGNILNNMKIFQPHNKALNVRNVPQFPSTPPGDLLEQAPTPNTFTSPRTTPPFRANNNNNNNYYNNLVPPEISETVSFWDDTSDKTTKITSNGYFTGSTAAPRRSWSSTTTPPRATKYPEFKSPVRIPLLSFRKSTTTTTTTTTRKPVKRKRKTPTRKPARATSYFELNPRTNEISDISPKEALKQHLAEFEQKRRPHYHSSTIPPHPHPHQYNDNPEQFSVPPPTTKSSWGSRLDDPLNFMSENLEPPKPTVWEQTEDGRWHNIKTRDGPSSNHHHHHHQHQPHHGVNPSYGYEVPVEPFMPIQESVQNNSSSAEEAAAKSQTSTASPIDRSKVIPNQKTTTHTSTLGRVVVKTSTTKPPKPSRPPPQQAPSPKPKSQTPNNPKTLSIVHIPVPVPILVPNLPTPEQEHPSYSQTPVHQSPQLFHLPAIKPPSLPLTLPKLPPVPSLTTPHPYDPRPPEGNPISITLPKLPKLPKLPIATPASYRPTEPSLKLPELPKLPKLPPIPKPSQQEVNDWNNFKSAGLNLGHALLDVKVKAGAVGLNLAGDLLEIKDKIVQHKLNHLTNSLQKPATYQVPTPGGTPQPIYQHPSPHPVHHHPSPQPAYHQTSSPPSYNVEHHEPEPQPELAPHVPMSEYHPDPGYVEPLPDMEQTYHGPGTPGHTQESPNQVLFGTLQPTNPSGDYQPPASYHQPTPAPESYVQASPTPASTYPRPGDYHPPTPQPVLPPTPAYDPRPHFSPSPSLDPITLDPFTVGEAIRDRPPVPVPERPLDTWDPVNALADPLGPDDFTPSVGSFQPVETPSHHSTNNQHHPATVYELPVHHDPPVSYEPPAQYEPPAHYEPQISYEPPVTYEHYEPPIHHEEYEPPSHHEEYEAPPIHYEQYEPPAHYEPPTPYEPPHEEVKTLPPPVYHHHFHYITTSVPHHLPSPTPHPGPSLSTPGTFTPFVVTPAPPLISSTAHPPIPAHHGEPVHIYEPPVFHSVDPPYEPPVELHEVPVYEPPEHIPPPPIIPDYHARPVLPHPTPASPSGCPRDIGLPCLPHGPHPATPSPDHPPQPSIPLDPGFFTTLREPTPAPVLHHSPSLPPLPPLHPSQPPLLSPAHVPNHPALGVPSHSNPLPFNPFHSTPSPIHSPVPLHTTPAPIHSTPAPLHPSPSPSGHHPSPLGHGHYPHLGPGLTLTTPHPGGGHSFHSFSSFSHPSVRPAKRSDPTGTPLLDEEWVEVEVVGRTKKQIGPETEMESKQKEEKKKKYKPFSAFSVAPPTSKIPALVEEKNSIFNFKSDRVKTEMNSYDPFFPASKKEDEWITMESPHLPDLKDTLAIRYDGDPTVPPLVKQLETLPPFNSYLTPPRSQRRSDDDWGTPRRQNGHASVFRFPSSSSGNLEVFLQKAGSTNGKSPGRRLTKFAGGSTEKDPPSQKIVMEGKVHSNESERMIAEALQKIHQRRIKSESGREKHSSYEERYAKHSNHADVDKDIDYDAEKLIEQANITEFLKL